MIPIYQFGTFDVANYGDLLFPLLAQRRLASLDTKIIAVSPIGGAPVWEDCMPSIRVDEIENIGHPACVLIGGGYIIRLLPMRLPVYNYGTVPLLGNPDLWVGASHLAMHEIPVCWNAPGVPFSFSKEQRPFVCECIERSDYVSVRDEPSRNFLLEACPGADIAVVPDPVWEISNFWTPHELSEAYERSFLSRGQDKPSRSIAVHVNTAFVKGGMEKTIAGWLDQISEDLDAKIILLSIGPCHGDDKLMRFVSKHMKTSPLLIDKPNSLKEIASCIAHADLYLGSSMHGLITASSFCVPGICVTSSDIPKFRGLQEQFNCNDTWSLSWEEVPSQVSSMDMDLKKVQLRHLRLQMQKRLDCHWDRITSIISKYSQAWGGLVGKDINACRKVTKKVFTYRVSLAAMEATKNIHLYDQAKKAIIEKEQMITSLRDKVSQKEGVIIEKEQALCEANVIVTEKEQIITTLLDEVSQKEKIITEKDQTITRLRDDVFQKEKVITEKDQALRKANVIITEKDQTITSLRDEVSRKDKLFREIDKTLTETRTSIVRKDREIHRYREELFSVYSSRSWRCTLPLRKVGSLVRRILTFPHQSRIRAMIKCAYFLLPVFIRNSQMIENLKNRFKTKEMMK